MLISENFRSCCCWLLIPLLFYYHWIWGAWCCMTAQVKACLCCQWIVCTIYSTLYCTWVAWKSCWLLSSTIQSCLFWYWFVIIIFIIADCNNFLKNGILHYLLLIYLFFFIKYVKFVISICKVECGNVINFSQWYMSWIFPVVPEYFSWSRYHYFSWSSILLLFWCFPQFWGESGLIFPFETE